MSCACTTARIADSTATARERSPLSSTGCRAGVTSASNLLQLTKRCAHPLFNYGRASVLYREGREPEGQAHLSELPRRIRSPRALASLPEEKRVAARHRRGRQEKVCEGFFVYGAAGRPSGVLQMPEAFRTDWAVHRSHQRQSWRSQR